MKNRLVEIGHRFKQPWNEVGFGIPNTATLMEETTARFMDLGSLGMLVLTTIEVSNSDFKRAGLELAGYALIRVMRKHMLERRNFLERYNYGS